MNTSVNAFKSEFIISSDEHVEKFVKIFKDVTFGNSINNLSDL